MVIDKNLAESMIRDFVTENSALISEKIKILDDTKLREDSFKLYIKEISEIEKQQLKIKLNEFEKLRDSIKNRLSDFVPYNIEYNIQKVKEVNFYLKELEKEIIELYESLDGLKKAWQKFLAKSPDFSGTVFDDYIKEKIQNINSKISTLMYKDIGRVNAEIDADRIELNRIILLVEKIENYLQYNMFIGEEAKEIEKQLTDLKNNRMSLTIVDFNNQAKEILDEADKIKERSQLTTVAIPVVKAYSKANKSISKNTLRFGKYILKYDSFFNSDNLVFEDINRNVYIANFPLEGIHSGAEIVEEIHFDTNYVQGVRSFTKKAYNSFMALVVFFSILALVVTTISFVGTIIVFMLFLATTFFYVPFFRFLKKSEEDYRELEDIYIFDEINYFIVKEGHTTNMQDLLLGSVREIDNTILNLDLHKTISTQRKNK